MSNLTDLVPPLELCKKIPGGEFAESAFLREAEVNIYTGEIINDRIVPRPNRIKNNPYVNHDLGREYHLYPAPTLVEIIADLPDDVFFGREKSGEYYISKRNAPRIKCSNPASAALKLWLKEKHIDRMKCPKCGKSDLYFDYGTEMFEFCPECDYKQYNTKSALFRDACFGGANGVLIETELGTRCVPIRFSEGIDEAERY